MPKYKLSLSRMVPQLATFIVDAKSRDWAIRKLERHIRRGGHVKWESLSMLLENYRIGNVFKLESEVDNADT